MQYMSNRRSKGYMIEEEAEGNEVGDCHLNVGRRGNGRVMSDIQVHRIVTIRCSVVHFLVVEPSQERAPSLQMAWNHKPSKSRN